MRFRFWLAAVLTLALDQYTKWLAVTKMPHPGSIPVIPHFLSWTWVENTHGAFGLFGNSPVLLVLMAVVVLGVFWYAFHEAAATSVLVRISFGMIAGGAIGNIIDRFHYQYVVDFIDAHIETATIHFFYPVFNVADSCITIGVGLLVIHSLRKEKAAPKAVVTSPQPEPAAPAEPAQ